MTARLDRATLDPYDAHRLDLFASRKRANLDANRCINDYSGTHGPRVDDGVRCLHCKLVHRYGAVIAAQQPNYVPLQR